ncbi:MAG: hypothetical protein WDM87_11455 [Terracidiphilus sp.]
MKNLIGVSIAAMMVAAVAPVHAAQLATDARGAIPHDVQQLVVIDYRDDAEFDGSDESAQPRGTAGAEAVR